MNNNTTIRSVISLFYAPIFIGILAMWVYLTTQPTGFLHEVWPIAMLISWALWIILVPASIMMSSFTIALAVKSLEYSRGFEKIVNIITIVVASLEICFLLWVLVSIR